MTTETWYSAMQMVLSHMWMPSRFASRLSSVADLQVGSIAVDVVPIMLASDANEPSTVGEVRMVPISFAPASVPESILGLIGTEISREQIEALSDDGVESFQYVPAGSIVQNS